MHNFDQCGQLQVHFPAEARSQVVFPDKGISPLHPRSVQAPVWPYNFVTAAFNKAISWAEHILTCDTQES